MGSPLPRGLKGQRKEAGAVLGERYSQQRGAAQPERWMQLPRNHSLAKELGETKPILSIPIPILLPTPLVEPKWKPEAKGAQRVQAAEGSFPECRAERVKTDSRSRWRNGNIRHKWFFPKYGPHCICIRTTLGARFKSSFLGFSLNLLNQNIYGS